MLNEELKLAQDVAKGAVEMLQRTTYRIQAACKHPLVKQEEYQVQQYTGTIPPKRQCICCELKEEGWNCGWKKLAKQEGRLIFNADGEAL